MPRQNVTEEASGEAAGGGDLEGNDSPATVAAYTCAHVYIFIRTQMYICIYTYISICIYILYHIVFSFFLLGEHILGPASMAPVCPDERLC